MDRLESSPRFAQFGYSFCEMMKTHFKDIERHQTFRHWAGPTRLDLTKGIKFVGALIVHYLEWTHIDFTLHKMKLDLSESAQKFYQEQLAGMMPLYVLLDQAVYGYIFMQPDIFKVIREEGSRMDTLRKTIQQTKCAVGRIDYYLSVGDSLLKLRNSGQRGKFAILCDRKFITADWLRAIPRIIERNDSCVTVRQF